MSDASSEELDRSDKVDMSRLAGGHDAALNDLMERHGQRLFHYLLRSVKEEDAADLSQETFVRVFQHRATFKGDSKFSTWLYTIATNLLRDRFRYKHRHPQISLDAVTEESGEGFAEQFSEGAPTPSENLVAEERAEQVRRAVQALPEELRTPLILFEYEDQSQADIATILNCSVKAVETRIYRARNQLRKQLASLFEGDDKHLKKT